MFSRHRHRESLFEPRRRRRGRARLAFRLVALGLLAMLAVIALRKPVMFYTALYESRRAVDAGDFQRAREAYQRAWTLRPQDPYLYDLAGYTFLKQGEPGWRARAREQYAEAMRRGLSSYYRLIDHVREGRAFLDAGRYDQAEVEIEHALELNPRSAEANLLQGLLLYARGHLAKAIPQLQAALALSPRSTEIQAALARAQEARSRGSVPYILDRNGQVLAATNLSDGAPVYPSDFWTAHIIGYRSASRGRSGLEEALGDRLLGNVAILTVDARLQRIADAALGWQKGSIVILKPQTGEILAAVSHPTYRPSQIEQRWSTYRNNPNEPLKNRSFESLYEPGSIGKIISAAALIESRSDIGKLFPFRCRGHLMIGSQMFWDWTAHKNVANFSEAFNNSCNVAMARVAPLVGASTLTQFLRSFGFAEQDRIQLEIPVAQSHAPLESNTPYDLATTFVGLGSQFRITPLHAAMVAAAVANGGVMMAPRLVREIRSVTGEVIVSRPPKIFKISTKKETAAQLTAHMIDFVQSGIGRKARVLRYHVAGKTGTSGNSKKGLHGWFICFAPAEKPELAVAVLCENGGSGHGVAAPVAQRVLTEALR
jgi:peptidoglycan glycosyltransferase